MNFESILDKIYVGPKSRQIRKEVIDAYFNYVKPIFKSFRHSELSLANSDIIMLNRKLESNQCSFLEVHIKSTKLKRELSKEEFSHIKSLFNQKNLNEDQKTIIRTIFLSKLDYIQESCLILEILIKQNKKKTLLWLIGVIIGNAGLISLLLRFFNCP